MFPSTSAALEVAMVDRRDLRETSVLSVSAAFRAEAIGRSLLKEGANADTVAA